MFKQTHVGTRQTSLVTLLSLSLLGALGALAGCSKTEKDVEHWKGTMKGPQKMLAVIQNSEKYDLGLRTRAALALIEMNRPEIKLRSGVVSAPIDVLETKLQEALESDRHQLINQMTPELIKLMNTPSPEGPDPSDLQVRAKDGVFRILPHAPPDTKRVLIDELMKWYAVDFSGRSNVGTASAEQVIDGVVAEVGPSAVKQLEGALSPQMPHPAMAKLAQLLSMKASKEIKKDAAKHLVQIYDEVTSDKHLKWWEEEVKRQFAEAGQKIEEKDLKRTAIHNREIQVTGGVLTAMKYFASEPVVADRLLKIATTSQDKDAIEDERRRAALAALEGKAQKSHLPTLMNIAFDPNNSDAIQDYAFDRIADIGDKSALPRLWTLFETGEQRKRWRAGEMILQIGGPSVVGQFFEKMPSGKETKYEPEELEGYAVRMAEMKNAPSATVRRNLSSPKWFERILALEFMERTATDKQLSQIKALTKSKDEVVGDGWEGRGIKTVGDAAKQSLEAAQTRLKASKS